MGGGDIVPKKSADRQRVEQLEEVLDRVREEMQRDLPRGCMGRDCAERASIEIRGIDAELVMHTRPIVLCKACFKPVIDNIDTEKWKGK